MLYINHFLERLYQFYILVCISLRQKCNNISAIHNLCLRKTISVWVSDIQTLKSLRQKFNIIHVIQNFVLKTLSQFFISIWISDICIPNDHKSEGKWCILSEKVIIMFTRMTHDLSISYYNLIHNVKITISWFSKKWMTIISYKIR